MAVVFKYKEPLNRTYAPGYTKSGVDGIVGSNGTSGNAMYFTKNDLDNSYEIKNVLQKIDSNLILDDTKNEPLLNRAYKAGDLLVSNSGHIYRIKLSDENSLFSNFKYDIEEIGVLSKKVSRSLKRVNIFDLTDCYVYNGKTAIKDYNPTTNKLIIHTDKYPFSVKGVKPIYWDSSKAFDADIKDTELPNSFINETTNEQNNLLFVPYIDPLDTDYYPYLLCINKNTYSYVVIAAKKDSPEISYEYNGINVSFKTFEFLQGKDGDETFDFEENYTLIKKFFLKKNTGNAEDNDLCVFETPLATGEFAVDVDTNKFIFERTYDSDNDIYVYKLSSTSPYITYKVDSSSDMYIRSIGADGKMKHTRINKFYIDSSMQLMLSDGRLLKQKELEYVKFKTDIDLSAPIKSYPIISKTCLPSYRTEKPYAAYNDEKFANYDIAGDWFKMIAETPVLPYSTYSKKSGLDGCSYGLQIELVNEKKMSLNSMPIEENDLSMSPIESNNIVDKMLSSFAFYKTIEFPNLTCTTENIVSKGWRSKTLVNMLFNEIKPKYNVNSSYTYNTSPSLKEAADENLYIECDEFNYNLPKCTTTYLSDYTLDDIHKAGNEIRCTISADRKMWYKSGINSEVLIDTQNINTPASLKFQENTNDSNVIKLNVVTDDYRKWLSTGKDNKEEYLFEDDSVNPEDIKNVINFDDYLSLTSYGAGLQFTPINVSLKGTDGITYTKDASSSVQFDSTWFPSYAIGLNITSASEDELQSEFNNKTWVGYKSLSTEYEANDASINLNDDPDYNLGTNLNLHGFMHAGYPFAATNIIQYPSYLSDYSVTTSPNKSGYIKSYKAKNYKAGNSLYFSGMTDYRDTASNIFRYISNSENNFLSIYRDHKTREMSISEVPVVFNTVLKDSSVFLWFDNNFATNTVEISAICITNRDGYVKVNTKLI